MIALEPSKINSIDELKGVAASMKKAAGGVPLLHPIKQSPNKAAAIENAVKPDVQRLIFERIKNGEVRLIAYRGMYISLDITLDSFEKTQWHLSMGKSTPTGPEEVPEEVSKEIAEAFFGKFEEGPRGTGFSNVRHFFAEPDFN